MSLLTPAAAADWTRRRWLQAGAFSALGMSLPGWMKATAAATSAGGRARNVLVILEQGGMSHIDTWDPKPNLVSEHRSPYQPIATRVPGLQFTSLLPKTAEVADKLTVVRSFRHPRGGADDHPGGTNLNWDHHDHIYASKSCELPGASGAGAGRYGIAHWTMMGSVDTAFSALIRDLDERGLLAETLVCLVTEFGRTPKINKHGGRDHWPHAYSMVFAGAGVPGGQVIGHTDEEGGYVLSQPYGPEDYAATVYEKLGIDRDKPLHTPANRPVYFGHMGEPIAGLI